MTGEEFKAKQAEFRATRNKIVTAGGPFETPRPLRPSKISPTSEPDAGSGRIPEVAHVVWLTGTSGKDDSGNPIPGAHIRNIAQFVRLNPNWNITCWTDDPRTHSRMPFNVEIRH